MLGPYGETIVLDWGLAKVLGRPDEPATGPAVRAPSSGSTDTQAGQVMGSPEYMAPEVAEGRAAEADERTDVYLLGSTLYHLLTGHKPRQGRTFEEMRQLACTVPPPSPRKVKRDAPRPSPPTPSPKAGEGAGAAQDRRAACRFFDMVQAASPPGRCPLGLGGSGGHTRIVAMLLAPDVGRRSPVVLRHGKVSCRASLPLLAM